MSDIYLGTGDNTWYTWSTGTTGGTSSAIWTSWSGNTAANDDGNSGYQEQCQTSVDPLDRNQIRRNQLNDARNRGIVKRTDREKTEAGERAKKLLLDLIGKIDYKKYLSLGYLEVEGKTGKTYRIRPRHEIEIMRDGLCIESLCIVTPSVYLPEADEVAWKKLLIEADEEKFLEVANHSVRT